MFYGAHVLTSRVIFITKTSLDAFSFGVKNMSGLSKSYVVTSMR